MKKKESFIIIGFVIMVIGIMILVIQSDFVKSRKTVDEEWMIGKSVSQVRFRYSCPNNIDNSCYDEMIFNNELYSFCVREIYSWNIINNNYEEVRFFVQTDDEGKIIDVKRSELGLEWPSSHYNYWDRW